MASFQVPFRLPFRVALVLGAVGLASGCGHNSQVAPAPGTVGVAGKVTVEGQPLSLGDEPDANLVVPRAMVLFLPDKVGGPAKPLVATGAVDKEGNYRLVSDGRPGAAVGRYKVVVMVGAVFGPGPDGKPAYQGSRKTGLFDEKFSDPDRTPFTIQVQDNAKPGAYDLELTR